MLESPDQIPSIHKPSPLPSSWRSNPYSDCGGTMTSRRRPPPPPWYKILGRCIFCLSCSICMCLGRSFNNYLKKVRKEIFGYEEWHQRWPQPAPEHTREILTASSKRSMRPAYNREAHKDEEEERETPVSGFFRLPFEIRTAIYDLIFPFKEIHLVKTFYKGNISEYRLESYACQALPKYQQDFMCLCTLSENERYGRSGRTHNLIHDRHPNCFPRERSKGQVSGSGLWEVLGILYTSKAFHEDVLAFLLQQRTFQIFGVDTTILFGVVMPRAQFHSIRSIYLNAKFIAPRSSFTGPISHFPRSYRDRFAHLPLAPSQDFRQPAADSPLRTRHTSTWHAACHILSQMSSLNVLKMQLCHSAFSDVLFANAQEKVISNEEWVFAPLSEIARKRGTGMGLFEVEVDWPAGDEGWDDREKGFNLTRVGPRSRGW